MLDKRSLRATYRDLRAAPNALGDREKRSEQIIRGLEAILAKTKYKRLGAYMAMADEPELTEWLQTLLPDKEIYLPRVKGEDMHFYRYEATTTLETSTTFGIREPKTQGTMPIAPELLDVLIVPGITFNTLGYRLGRGKGYYDRYLTQTKALTIGVSLGLMPLEILPTDPWDKPIDLVLQP